MKISCHYCGHIHDDSFCCEAKAKARKKPIRDIERFRRSKQWTNKREHIIKRDMHTCLCCKYKVFDLGYRQIYTEYIEVHHIIPMIENYDLRLVDDNLISLCREHHELAEKGTISRETLQELIRINSAKI